MNHDLQEQLKLDLNHSLDKFQIPGATVAVHINNQSFLETGVGYQNLEQEIPLNADAKFYIYSITKSLLATASLHLVSEGLLNLCLLYTSPSPRDGLLSRMPSSA